MVAGEKDMINNMVKKVKYADMMKPLIIKLYNIEIDMKRLRDEWCDTKHKVKELNTYLVSGDDE